MTSRSGGEHDSLFDLPFSGDLLASKVTQIDDAIQYEPLVGSSAWKSEIKNLCSAVLRNRVQLNESTMISHWWLWIFTGRIRRARKCFFSRDEITGRHFGHDTYDLRVIHERRNDDERWSMTPRFNDRNAIDNNWITCYWN